MRFREIERAAAVAERGEGPAEMGGGSKRPLTSGDGMESRPWRRRKDARSNDETLHGSSRQVFAFAHPADEVEADPQSTSFNPIKLG